MARQRSIEGATRVVPLNLEAEEYDKFVENLPRKKSVSEAIREYMKSVNDEAEKIKNLNSPNYSAVKDIYDIYISSSETNKVNSTLDIWLLDKRDIVNHIDSISDIKTLAQIEDKGKVFYTIAQTRKRKILKGEIKS